jgi:lipoprotein-anchoring transpeptidase ErfK/SrfK
MSPARRVRFSRLLRLVVLALLLSGCGVATTALAATSAQPDPTGAAPLVAPGTVGRLVPIRAPRRPRPAHAIVSVRKGRSVTMRSTPGGHALERLGVRTRFGTPTALSVVKRRGRWLGVSTADRPNGRLGWVRSAGATLRRTTTHLAIHVDLSARRLELRRRGSVLARSTVSIGRPGSPTPTGRFAVTEKLRGDRFGSYYGCCILVLSATQPHTPRGWPGGNRVAIHGTASPGSLGSAESAGCLHASATALKTLMRRVPVGTPVVIDR